MNISPIYTQATSEPPTGQDAQIDLQAMNDQQAETITRYQRENDGLTRRVDMLQDRVDHSQAYIAKLKAQRAELKAQLTPEAKAEWIFDNEQHAGS